MIQLALFIIFSFITVSGYLRYNEIWTEKNEDDFNGFPTEI